MFMALGESHSVLVVSPPTQCESMEALGSTADRYESILSLVMDNGLATNSFRAGRWPRDQVRYHCVEALPGFADGEPRPRTAYLLTPRGLARRSVFACRLVCRPSAT